MSFQNTGSLTKIFIGLYRGPALGKHFLLESVRIKSGSVDTQIVALIRIEQSIREVVHCQESINSVRLEHTGCYTRTLKDV